MAQYWDTNWDNFLEAYNLVIAFDAIAAGEGEETIWDFEDLLNLFYRKVYRYYGDTFETCKEEFEEAERNTLNYFKKNNWKIFEYFDLYFANEEKQAVHIRTLNRSGCWYFFNNLPMIRYHRTNIWLAIEMYFNPDMLEMDFNDITESFLNPLLFKKKIQIEAELELTQKLITKAKQLQEAKRELEIALRSNSDRPKTEFIETLEVEKITVVGTEVFTDEHNQEWKSLRLVLTDMLGRSPSSCETQSLAQKIVKHNKNSSWQIPQLRKPGFPLMYPNTKEIRDKFTELRKETSESMPEQAAA